MLNFCDIIHFLEFGFTIYHQHNAYFIITRWKGLLTCGKGIVVKSSVVMG